MPRVHFAVVWLVALGTGCRDLSGFTTSGDHFEGMVVAGDFVRAGVDTSTSLCLTIDANRLQDDPGTLSTSDGRFQTIALRPIPQIWHDPLSTLSFGEGRLKNLVYVATASASYADGKGDDVLVLVSLMQSGHVEVRLIRGAPGLPSEGGTGSSGTANVFAVFDLVREAGPCSF